MVPTLSGEPPRCVPLASRLRNASLRFLRLVVLVVIDTRYRQLELERCYCKGSMTRRRTKLSNRTKAGMLPENVGGDDEKAMRLLCSVVHHHKGPGMTHDKCLITEVRVKIRQ